MSERSASVLLRAMPDVEYRRAKHPKVRRAMSGRRALIDDTETVTDLTLNILFGSARLVVDKWDGHDLTVDLIKTVLYYDDNLPVYRPRTYRALCKVSTSRGIELMKHSEFVRDYLLRLGYPETTSRDYQPGTVVQYNASFDMFRHGTRATNTYGFYRDGMGCEFLNGEPFTPRYREKRAGVGAMRELSGPFRRSDFRYWEPPAVLDLPQLVFALTGQRYSLLAAGRAFGCNALKFDKPEIHDPEVNYKGPNLQRQIEHYVLYNLQDVEATVELYTKVLTRFYRHPIRLRPELCFSPASISKRYLEAMGVHGSLCTCQKCKVERRGAWRIPRATLGKFMAAFLGARSEAGTRLTVTPSVLYDWKSMYPTIMILCGIWELFISQSIECREDTERIQNFLNTVTLEDCFRPDTWLILCGIAELRPDGDLLPVRMKPDENEGNASVIATGYIVSDKDDPPMPWSIADLVASKIRTGKVPQITRAYGLYPSEDMQSTLKSVKFSGDETLTFNPASGNLLRFLVERRQHVKNTGDPERTELGLKLIANCIYGVFAEMNVKSVSKSHKDRPDKHMVYGIDGMAWPAANPEEPGEFANGLFAPIITGGARLMLSMFQVMAGSPVMTDTDSFASPVGDESHTPDDIREIAERFDSLNPYDQIVIPHLIERQQPSSADGETPLAMAVSAKRYAFFDLGDHGKVRILRVEDSPDSEVPSPGMKVLKRSEHGLGLYLSPYANAAAQAEDSDEASRLRKRFVDEVWTYGIQRFGMGRSPADPWWFTLPAVSRFPIRTRNILRAFDQINQGIPYSEQVKPGNFYLAVHVPRGFSEDRIRLVAPFSPDPSTWLKMMWMDVHTGKRYQITTNPGEEIPGKVILVKTFRNVVWDYFTHPEIKYDGPDGKPCGMHTRGILQPATIRISGYKHITKDAGSVVTSGEAFEYQGPRTYHDDTESRLMATVRGLCKRKGIGRGNLEALALIPEKVARNFLSGSVDVTRAEHRSRIISVARSIAVSELTETGNWRPLHSDTEIIREWTHFADAGILPVEPYKASRIMPAGIELVAEDVPIGAIDEF